MPAGTPEPSGHFLSLLPNTLVLPKPKKPGPMLSERAFPVMKYFTNNFFQNQKTEKILPLTFLVLWILPMA